MVSSYIRCNLVVCQNVCHLGKKYNSFYWCLLWQKPWKKQLTWHYLWLFKSTDFYERQISRSFIGSMVNKLWILVDIQEEIVSHNGCKVWYCSVKIPWRPGFSNIFRSFPMSDDKASVCLLFEAFCLLWVIKGEINDIWLNMLHTINQSKVLKMTYMLKQITQLCM